MIKIQSNRYMREKLHNCNVLKLIGKLVRDWNYHNKVCFLWIHQLLCSLHFYSKLLIRIIARDSLRLMSL